MMTAAWPGLRAHRREPSCIPTQLRGPGTSRHADTIPLGLGHPRSASPSPSPPPHIPPKSTKDLVHLPHLFGHHLLPNLALVDPGPGTTHPKIDDGQLSGLRMAEDVPAVDIAMEHPMSVEGAVQRENALPGPRRVRVSSVKRKKGRSWDRRENG